MTVRPREFKQKFLYPALCEKYEVEVSLFRNLYDRYGANARDIVGDTHNWELPAMGEPYDNCGSWRSRGCQNEHEVYSGEGGYYELYHRNCQRKSCPVCYEAWCLKLASKNIYRIMAIVGNRKKALEISAIHNHKDREREINRYMKYLRDKFKKHVDHVIVSVPKKYYHLSYKELKKKVSKILKSSGITGYLSIFHPFRKVEKKGAWYYSPHFHLLAIGWIKPNYNRYGFVIRKLPQRHSYLGTIAYQLSHAGIRKNSHVTTWHGSFSYNKVKVPKFVMPKKLCPHCGDELLPVIYIAGTLDEIFEKASKGLNPRDCRLISFMDSNENWVRRYHYF